MLQFAAMPAERMRGAQLVEDFYDMGSMQRNGWTLYGSPLFAKNGGLVLNGTTQYTSIPLGNELARTTITVHLEWIPVHAAQTNDYIIDTSATNRFGILDVGGSSLGILFGGVIIHQATYATWNALLLVGKRNLLTITKIAGSAAVVWLNGSVLANSVGVSTPSGGATTPLLVGKVYAAGVYYAATFSRILIGHYLCTLAEHQAYYARTMWNWEDRCLVNLQLRTGDYDPTAVRTLDSSGNGKHFTLGDGVTASSFPAQGKGRMTFDGTDYLERTSFVQPAGAFSVATTMSLTSLASNMYPVESGNAPNYNFIVLRLTTGVYRFYVGNSLYAYSAAYPDQRAHTVVCVYDGSIARIYIDGIAGVDSGATAPVGGTASIKIGQRGGGGGEIIGSVYDFKYRDGEAWNQVQVNDYHQKMMSTLGAQQ